MCLSGVAQVERHHKSHRMCHDPGNKTCSWKSTRGPSMPPFKSPSVLFFKTKLTLAKVGMVSVLILTIILPSWGQARSAKPGPHTAKVHWRKYVNREYRFSFWYPNNYGPTKRDRLCSDNDYREYLLCLKRQDDPDALLLVTVVVATPFLLQPNHGNVMPVHQKIGNHDFYCGLGGSMGTGFTDQCIFNLRGKVLEFNFSPAQTVNSSDKTNSLLFKSLKTFRIF